MMPEKQQHFFSVQFALRLILVPVHILEINHYMQSLRVQNRHICIYNDFASIKVSLISTGLNHCPHVNRWCRIELRQSIAVCVLPLLENCSMQIAPIFCHLQPQISQTLWVDLRLVSRLVTYKASLALTWDAITCVYDQADSLTTTSMRRHKK